MRKRTARIAAVAVAAGVALGACGGDEDPSVTVEESSEDAGSASGSASEATDTTGGEAAVEHNDADVAFAQQMIVHHQQAIDMARLASDRAESPDVLDLAARIEAAQQPEIDLMTDWLQGWGEEPMAGHDMDMSGMGMSEDEMEQLEAATGAEFDRMFLEMMIRHHEGAIEMAETEIAEGSDPKAIELAEKIVEDQTAEIEEMQALLDQG